MIRNLIERIGRGSGTLTRSTLWYLLARDKTGQHRAKAVTARLSGLSVSSWFVGMMLHSWGALYWTIAFGWFIVALYLSAMTEGLEEEDSQVFGQDPDPIDILPVLHELLGDNNGVHLSAIAAHLNCQLGDVHHLLGQADIPTRHSVKVKGNVAVGVRRVHVPPLPSPTSESGEDPQVAGSTAGQSATATATYEIREINGERVAYIDDPDNPARTHLLHLDKEAS